MTVQTITRGEPLSLPRRDILRYMRCPTETAEVAALVDEAMEAVTPLLRYRACFARFPLMETESGLHLGFAETESRSLKRHLAGCNEVLVMAATVGSEVDRLLARLSALSPARAVAADAVATAAIEAWCDHLCTEWAGQGLALTARFSAGYGDCPLELQIPLMGALDTSRKIGLTLTDSLLMTPKKSVTAMIGISNI